MSPITDVRYTGIITEKSRHLVQPSLAYQPDSLLETHPLSNQRNHLEY